MTKIQFLLKLLVFSCSACALTGFTRPVESIVPYPENPFYWQMNGEPVVLIGGSDDDNLFQMEALAEQLDILQACGGNYVRCAISCRDEGNEWWFAKDPETGLYDLNRPNESMWTRFRNFLEMTRDRGIVAQIELWDRHDFKGEYWDRNPYNPENNINYTEETSGLPVDSGDANRICNAIFGTVPELHNNTTVLKFQKEQVDKLLSISLQYGNVLYCMDNESDQTEEWSRYWANHVRSRAQEKGVRIAITEMWNKHDLNDPQHLRTVNHPELYDFIDISQNNHQYARQHWDNLQAFRQKIIDSGHIRPLTSVKIYGKNAKAYGSTRDGLERFWRLILGGAASARFHRPPWGLGLNHLAQAHLQAMSLALKEHDIFNARPARDLLRNCSRNEAYCSAIPGSSYLLFFPDGGDILLLTEGSDANQFTVRFIDIRMARWDGVSRLLHSANGRLRIQTPREDGYWAAIVKPVEN